MYKSRDNEWMVNFWKVYGPTNIMLEEINSLSSLWYSFMCTKKTLKATYSLQNTKRNRRLIQIIVLERLKQIVFQFVFSIHNGTRINIIFLW